MTHFSQVTIILSHHFFSTGVACLDGQRAALLEGIEGRIEVLIALKQQSLCDKVLFFLI